MEPVEDVLERLEQLIEEHLERNPRIAGPSGAGDDMEFRDAVRENFGIMYEKGKPQWIYRLPGGGKKTKSCLKKGVLDTLRDVCKEKVALLGIHKQDARSMKRKLDEGSSTTAESDLSKSWMETAKLRREVHALKRENADLRWMNNDFAKRIKKMEMENTAALDRAVRSECTLQDYMEDNGIVDPAELDILNDEIENLHDEIGKALFALDDRNEARWLMEEYKQLSDEMCKLREEVRGLKGKLSKANEELEQLKTGNEGMSALKRRDLERLGRLLDGAKQYVMDGMSVTEVKEEPTDDIVDAQLAS
ncbi:hypothetical protein FOL47_002496 [Perkinsus chesapeaki]|uniref:Uncharacterized protein n=1 Tax=Perkinsus chesapeaki TaxID=330153 RepID=A0A7J6N101_PERCH|nr:hypothetical protein FOL47_002496 [Perkinsus chesapeaki]